MQTGEGDGRARGNGNEEGIGYDVHTWAGRRRLGDIMRREANAMPGMHTRSGPQDLDIEWDSFIVP